MGQRLDLGKQALWLKLVQRCQRSQLSVRDFCQQHEVSESNFYAWRRVLRERGLIDEQAQPAETGTPAFIKLMLPAAPAPASTVELVLGERVLRVRPGFDAAMLLELVRLLEEPA